MMLTQVEYLDYMARTTQSVHHQDEVGGRGEVRGNALTRLNCLVRRHEPYANHL